MRQQSRSACHRRGQGAAVLALSFVAALLSPARVVAADPPPSPQHRGGVISPPAHVDPGMTKTTPKMPPRSTPLIHPRQLNKGRQGNVEVVPK